MSSSGKAEVQHLKHYQDKCVYVDKKQRRNSGNKKDREKVVLLAVDE